MRTRVRTPPICHGTARARGDPACGAEPERAPLGDDGRTTRHAGYAMSLCLRKRIEEVFVRAKTVAGLSKRGSAACPSRLAIHSGKWPLLLVEAVS